MFLILAFKLSMVGCVSESPENINSFDRLTEPHVPIIIAPRVIIAEQTWEHEGQMKYDGKIFIPLDFGKDAQLQKIKNYLPVITFYPFDMTTLQGDGWNQRYFEQLNTSNHGVVFNETPERPAWYTLFNEGLDIVSTLGRFEFPSEIGDYILQINVFDTAYYARIVVGEPRGWCNRTDRYHGGGEGLKVTDFDTILEIRALLDQDDQAIEEYFREICDREDGGRMECPCFIRTRADLQSFFSWLRLDQVRLPFSGTATLNNIVLRGRYADIYVRYTIDEMLFNFILYPSNQRSTEDIMAGWGTHADSYKLFATVDDANIYIYESESNNDPRVLFILCVNGAYVSVSASISCANPDICDRGENFGSGHSCFGEWVDRQVAIDAIMQFEFRTLF